MFRTAKLNGPQWAFISFGFVDTPTPAATPASKPFRRAAAYPLRRPAAAHCLPRRTGSAREYSHAAEACLLIRSTALLASPAAHDGDALRGRPPSLDFFGSGVAAKMWLLALPLLSMLVSPMYCAASAVDRLLLGATTKAMPWQLRLG
uniref:Uncharacterized protein n=1 Tax=Oryza rufipogon TaxID=4529 RepID=A0A0E0Q3N7_ORYRU